MVRHVSCQSVHGLHPFHILPHLIGGHAMHKVPILRRYDRHLQQAEVFVQLIKRRRGSGGFALIFALSAQSFTLWPTREEGRKKLFPPTISSEGHQGIEWRARALYRLRGLLLSVFYGVGIPHSPLSEIFP